MFKIKFIKILFAFSVFSLFVFSTCSSGVERETLDEVYVHSYKEGDPYAGYLVKLESYTTDGGVYHKKYRDNLYTIARTITENLQLTLRSESVGFYYDDKMVPRLYYLGLDIVCEESSVDSTKSYNDNARKMMELYYRRVVEVVYPHKSVFNESEIDGIVIGFIWTRRSRREVVNIWSSALDFNKLMENQMTFRQFVIRSTVTDSDGNIIRLTL